MSEIITPAEQVSNWIATYNQVVGSTEILPKTPETIENSLEQNEACLITVEDKPMAYGAIYPLLDEKVSDQIGIMPVEIGSMISDPDNRGNGYGSQVARETRRLAEDNFPNITVLPLATIKRPVTVKALQKANINAVNFYDYPYLAYLTCVCDSGEQNQQNCRYRRPEEVSEPQDLIQIVEVINLEENLVIPCTFITDSDLAADFEQKCQTLHQQLSGESVGPGNISVESFELMRQFFEKLNQGGL